MTLEDDVRRLLDRHAIEELRAAYCFRIDSRDWEGFPELFTEDTTIVLDDVEEFHGRDGARRVISDFLVPKRTSTVHVLHNPTIDVNGDEATGHWYVTAFLEKGDGAGGLRVAQYQDEYLRVADEWRIDRMEITYLYTADYDQSAGWSDLSHVGTPW